MRLFPIILLLVGIVQGMAQTKTYVGLTAGGHVHSAILNHSIFNFNARLTFRSGFHAGFLVKHFPRKRDISFNAGIQGGMNYVQKGWAQTFPDTDLPNYRVAMNYIEIPLEGIGYFGNKNKYFLTLGFFIELLLDAEKDPQPVGLQNMDFATYESARDKEVGYGWRAGGGIFRDFPFGSLHLEGFLTFSFSNFIDAGDLTDDQLPDTSNLWTAGVSVGYLIPFGKLDLVK